MRMLRSFAYLHEELAGGAQREGHVARGAVVAHHEAPELAAPVLSASGIAVVVVVVDDDGHDEGGVGAHVGHVAQVAGVDAAQRGSGQADGLLQRLVLNHVHLAWRVGRGMGGRGKRGGKERKIEQMHRHLAKCVSGVPKSVALRIDSSCKSLMICSMIHFISNCKYATSPSYRIDHRNW